MHTNCDEASRRRQRYTAVNLGSRTNEPRQPVYNDDECWQSHPSMCLYIRAGGASDSSLNCRKLYISMCVCPLHPRTIGGERDIRISLARFRPQRFSPLLHLSWASWTNFPWRVHSNIRPAAAPSTRQTRTHTHIHIYWENDKASFPSLPLASDVDFLHPKMSSSSLTSRWLSVTVTTQRPTPRRAMRMRTAGTQPAPFINVRRAIIRTKAFSQWQSRRRRRLPLLRNLQSATVKKYWFLVLDLVWGKKRNQQQKITIFYINKFWRARSLHSSFVST